MQGNRHAAARREDIDDGLPAAASDDTPVTAGAATRPPNPDSGLTAVDRRRRRRAKPDGENAGGPAERGCRPDAAVKHVVGNPHGARIRDRARHRESAERLPAMPVARGRNRVEGDRGDGRGRGGGRSGGDEDQERSEGGQRGSPQSSLREPPSVRSREAVCVRAGSRTVARDRGVGGMGIDGVRGEHAASVAPPREPRIVGAPRGFRRVRRPGRRGPARRASCRRA